MKNQNRKNILIITSLILILNWSLLLLVDLDQKSLNDLLSILFVFLSIFWIPVLLFNYLIFFRKKDFNSTFYFRFISFLQSDKHEFDKSLRNTITIFTWICLVVYISMLFSIFLSIIS